MYFHAALRAECHPEPLTGNFAVEIGYFDSILRGMWSLTHLSTSSGDSQGAAWNKTTVCHTLA